MKAWNFRGMIPVAAGLRALTGAAGLICLFLLSISVGNAVAAEKADGEGHNLATAFDGFIDHTGKPFKRSAVPGKYLLINFGYTYCPDVCPTGLLTIAQALEELGQAAAGVVPIFVSVDPDRDKPSILGEYVGAFDPRFVGLVGSAQQTRSAADRFGVKYFKVFAMPSTNDDEEDKDDNANYSVSHSAFTYLIGPDGRLLATIPYGGLAADMAKRIKQAR